MAKKIEEKNEFFESLKTGLEAAIEHAKGTRKDLRTTTLPLPPKDSPQKRSHIYATSSMFHKRSSPDTNAQDIFNLEKVRSNKK